MSRLKFDFGLLISLLTSFITIWYFLLQKILYISETVPDNRNLMLFAVIHSIVSVFILLTSLVIYFMGLFPYSSKRRIVIFLTQSTKFIKLAWFPIVFCSVVSLFIDVDYTEYWMYFILAIVLVYLIIQLLFGSLKFNGLKMFDLSYVGVFVVFYALQTLGLQSYFADVEVKTNEEFYTDKDKIQISLRRKGYVFLPQIKSVKFGLSYDIWGDTKDFEECNNLEHIIDLSKFEKMPNNTFLTVEFETQTHRIKKKHIQLRIAKH